ncbi:hypothetical protein [Rhodococcoides fascians]|uniref:hypothetical protein n=1 Tax=Rhodococcoides fascians TaxID=1828 RepID=UPI000AC0C2ED|nr:hypothetical protein [Rhodococcus fascians]
MRLVPTFAPDPDYIDRQLDAEIATLTAGTGHRSGFRPADVRSPRPGPTPAT